MSMERVKEFEDCIVVVNGKVKWKKIFHPHELASLIDTVKQQSEQIEKLRSKRQNDLNYLSQKIKRIEELEQALSKVVRLAGTNKEIDYELWKYAKQAINKKEND